MLPFIKYIYNDKSFQVTAICYIQLSHDLSALQEGPPGGQKTGPSALVALLECYSFLFAVDKSFTHCLSQKHQIVVSDTGPITA